MEEERCWRTAVGGLTGGQRREGGDGGGGALLEDHGWRTDRNTDRQPREGGWRRSAVGGPVGGAVLEDRCWRTAVRYLLAVVGGVGQHGGDVEHDLVVLVGGVQGVGARRVRWGAKSGGMGGSAGGL